MNKPTPVNFINEYYKSDSNFLASFSKEIHFLSYLNTNIKTATITFHASAYGYGDDFCNTNTIEKMTYTNKNIYLLYKFCTPLKIKPDSFSAKINKDTLCIDEHETFNSEAWRMYSEIKTIFRIQNAYSLPKYVKIKRLYARKPSFAVFDTLKRNINLKEIE